MDVTLDINVKLDFNEPRRVVALFEEFAGENGASEAVVQRFSLALDEIITNVVSHAFEGRRSDPVIQVALGIADGCLHARVEDNGTPFDPLADAPIPDLTLSVEERPIGGLGLHLAKHLVHHLSYRRVHNRNCLTLRQPLQGGTGGSKP